MAAYKDPPPPAVSAGFGSPSPDPLSHTHDPSYLHSLLLSPTLAPHVSVYLSAYIYLSLSALSPSAILPRALYRTLHRRTIHISLVSNMSMSTSSSLSATVAHAVSFLTRPLLKSYSPTTIVKLQLALEANLTTLYAQSWVVNEPLRGSGRRCLTLSPDCLPPRAVYSACIAAGVQWFDWIALLGGREFDFFVDPGCVSMRLDRKGPSNHLITIWADEIPSPTVTKKPSVFGESRIQASIGKQVEARAKAYAAEKRKTLAQQLLEDDSESDDQIFTMIADEICAPTWMTPILAEFPKPRSLSPLSAISSHSRCSSRSSNSSSGFSFSSADSSRTSASGSMFSSPSAKSGDENAHPTQSRRERARQARVYVDTSKVEITPYDGGKTTVLTGGVMLGGGPKKAAPRPQTNNNWRSSTRI